MSEDVITVTVRISDGGADVDVFPRPQGEAPAGPELPPLRFRRSAYGKLILEYRAGGGDWRRVPVVEMDGSPDASRHAGRPGPYEEGAQQ